MSGIFAACRRVCCGRNVNSAQTHSKNTTQNTEVLQSRKSVLPMSPPPVSSFPQQEKNTVLANEHDGHDVTVAELNAVQNEIDLNHLAKEYLTAINEYRFYLDLPALELSSELTTRAVMRATQLAREDRVESSSRTGLIHNNQPIGETVMSCRAPVNDGGAIAKLTYNELMDDLTDGNPHKKRYGPILNHDCQLLGFGLARNEEQTKDFIVIYYYPAKHDEELWQTDQSHL